MVNTMINGRSSLGRISDLPSESKEEVANEWQFGENEHSRTRESPRVGFTWPWGVFDPDEEQALEIR